MASSVVLRRGDSIAGGEFTKPRVSRAADGGRRAGVRRGAGDAPTIVRARPGATDRRAEHARRGGAHTIVGGARGWACAAAFWMGAALGTWRIRQSLKGSVKKRI